MNNSKGNASQKQNKKIHRYEIMSIKINENIQFMNDHVVIGKFMGIWISKMALI